MEIADAFVDLRKTRDPGGIGTHAGRDDDLVVPKTLARRRLHLVGSEVDANGSVVDQRDVRTQQAVLVAHEVSPSPLEGNAEIATLEDMLERGGEHGDGEATRIERVRKDRTAVAAADDEHVDRHLTDSRS